MFLSLYFYALILQDIISVVDTIPLKGMRNTGTKAGLRALEALNAIQRCWVFLHTLQCV